MAIIKLWDKKDQFLIKATPHNKNFLTQIGDKSFQVSFFKKLNLDIFLKINQQFYKVKILKHTENKIEIYIFNFSKSFKFFLQNPNKIQNTKNIQSDNSFIDILKSPLSGRIIEIKVKENDFIQKNQVLLTIESMKMENEIKASNDCFIKTIHISQSNLVKTNQILMTFSKKENFSGTIKRKNDQKEI